MRQDYYYDAIYLLTAIGLSPGGSSEIITRNKVYFHNQQNFTELACSDVLYFVEGRNSSFM
jgi:hypothetical protein